MSLVLIVYLINVLPVIAQYLSVIGGVGSFFLVTGGVIFVLVSEFRTATSMWDNKEQIDHTNKVFGKMGRRALKASVFTLLLGLIAALIPSEKTMYTMAAVYAGQKIAETPAAQQIGNDAFDVLKGILAKAKRELAEEAPKK